MFVMVIILLPITQTLGQELPTNDPRNEMFRKHFIEVTNLNSEIKNFNTLDIGREYKLPKNQSDKLETGDSNGIWGREFKKFYGISYGAFLQGQGVPTPTQTLTPTPVPAATPSPTPAPGFWDGFYIPTWFWYLLGFLAALILLIWFFTWLYRRDPTQWRPVVQGGVRGPKHAEELFSDNFSGQGWQVVPGSLEKIRLYGPWWTKHLGLGFLMIPHWYNGLKAYRARVRKGNRERTRIITVECGNVTAHGWYWLGARIVEGWEDLKTPTQSPTPPTAPATSSSLVYTSEQEEAAKKEGFPSAADKDRHDKFVRSMFGATERPSSLNQSTPENLLEKVENKNQEEEIPKEVVLRMKRPFSGHPDGFFGGEGLIQGKDELDLKFNRETKVINFELRIGSAEDKPKPDSKA